MTSPSTIDHHHISADTLDDLLNDTFRLIRDKGLAIERAATSAKSNNFEIFGALLRLTNPRARFSRTENRTTLLSGLAELLWYLSGSDDVNFMTYYVEGYRINAEMDSTQVHGAYGPRLLAMRGSVNQIRNIIELLSERKDSRRAVVQLLNAEDVEGSIARKRSPIYVDIPCTTTFQFVIRNDHLYMMTYMRSNDIYKGLPHDIFAFTMLQEIVATSLSSDLGSYQHAVGSLHLYKSDGDRALRYLAEGYQETTLSMPHMPCGDPWPAIALVQAAERELRVQGRLTTDVSTVDPYWRDLIYLLEVFRAYKDEDSGRMRALAADVRHDIYKSWIDVKILDLEARS